MHCHEPKPTEGRSAAPQSLRLAFAALSLACLVGPSAGCVTTPPRPKSSFPAVAGDGFPESWTGVWSGPVQAHGPQGLLEQFSMQLAITPTDSPDRFDWRMVLAHPSGSQEQPFTLLAVDRAAGRFAIDENNGVVVDASWIDQALYSHFDVAGSRVQIRYLRRILPGVDELIVEMTNARVEDAHPTGGNHGAPEVLTLPIRTVQRAILHRGAIPAASSRKPLQGR